MEPRYRCQPAAGVISLAAVNSHPFACTHNHPPAAFAGLLRRSG